MTGKWNYQPLTHQEKRETDTLAEHVGGNAVVAELLIRRGVTTDEEADHFFSPSLSQLHDPFLMNDMDITKEDITVNLYAVQ